MALCALAIRQITRLALTDATLAGARVGDSLLMPADFKVAEEQAPTITIYTEAEDSQVTGMDVLAADRTLQLVIETSLARQTPIEGTDEVQISLPETDAAFEATLDLLARQILGVLWSSDGQWPALFRLFVSSVTKVEVRRANPDPSAMGVRFAARQMVLHCKPLAEPGFGREPAAGSGWAQLFAALEAHGGYGSMLQLIRAAFVGQELVDWRQAQALLGLTHEGVRGIGIAPAFETADDPAPEVTEVNLAPLED